MDAQNDEDGEEAAQDEHRGGYLKWGGELSGIAPLEVSLGSGLEGVGAEGVGREVGAVDEVDLRHCGEGVADVEGLLHFWRGQDDGASADFGFGLDPLLGVVGDPEGGGGFAVDGLEAVGVIEVDDDLVVFDFGFLKGGALGFGGGEEGETFSDGEFVLRVNVGEVAEVDGVGDAGVGEVEGFELGLAHPGP